MVGVKRGFEGKKGVPAGKGVVRCWAGCSGWSEEESEIYLRGMIEAVGMRR